MKHLALVLTLVSSFAAVSVAQEPWQGWHGPPAEGIYGLRFGMDRQTVVNLAVESGFKQLDAREGMMRFEGTRNRRRVEMVLQFHDDASGDLGGRLNRIQVNWQDLKGGAGRAIQFFDRVGKFLEEKHGQALVTRSGSEAELSAGNGSFLLLFRDVEVQVVLELLSPRPSTYNMSLLMDYPPLHDELAGS